MKNDRIDQALTALGFALKEGRDENPLNNPMSLVEKLPKRCFTGDHINGGKIIQFASQGITDNAKKEQIVISDDGVAISVLSTNKINSSIEIAGDVTAKNISATSITADVLNVKEIKADIDFDKNTPIKFSGELGGKGMLWSAKDYTKQFVFNHKPDRFFSSETIDLAKGKQITFNGRTVLSETELGPTVTKSNIREIGRLKGLVVDGTAVINDYLYFDGNSDRLGLGTDEPNAALSVAEMGTEVMLGTTETLSGMVGTFATNHFDIVTDNTPRITVEAGGNIQLGNRNRSPIQVSVHGSMGIDVNNADTRAKLHVNGAIKFNNSLHLKSSEPPKGGAFNQGDIVWNEKPQQKKYIGWVCIQSGSPGIWSPFGEIR